MAIYKQIEEWVKLNRCFVPKPCWIAHCKELEGLRPGIAHNRIDPNVRQVPCPPEKRRHIVDAFKYFGMIN